MTLSVVVTIILCAYSSTIPFSVIKELKLDAPFWEDSKSSGPKLVPFLIPGSVTSLVKLNNHFRTIKQHGNIGTRASGIRQENMKYSWKASRFGRFNLYQDPFFEEIMNLAMELLYFAWVMCYAQNGDWGPGGGPEMFSDLKFWL